MAFVAIVCIPTALRRVEGLFDGERLFRPLPGFGQAAGFVSQEVGEVAERFGSI